MASGYLADESAASLGREGAHTRALVAEEDAGQLGGGGSPGSRPESAGAVTGKGSHADLEAVGVHEGEFVRRAEAVVEKAAEPTVTVEGAAERSAEGEAERSAEGTAERSAEGTAAGTAERSAEGAAKGEGSRRTVSGEVDALRVSAATLGRSTAAEEKAEEKAEKKAEKEREDFPGVAEPWSEGVPQEGAVPRRPFTAGVGDESDESRVSEPSMPANADTQSSDESLNWSVIGDIRVKLTLEVGSREISVADLLELDTGSVVSLAHDESTPLDLKANGVLVARGEVVLAGDGYGVRVTQVVSPPGSAGLL